jgi:signal peptidase I
MIAHDRFCIMHLRFRFSNLITILLTIESVIAVIAVIIGAAIVSGRSFWFVGSGSMTPTIEVGALLLVAPTSDPHTGDVVVIRNPDGTHYTHRIVGLVNRSDGLYIRTKGDANANPDPVIVPARSVVGRVEAVLPAIIGWPLRILASPFGKLAVIALSMATLLAIASQRRLDTSGSSVTIESDQTTQLVA